MFCKNVPIKGTRHASKTKSEALLFFKHEAEAEAEMISG